MPKIKQQRRDTIRRYRDRTFGVLLGEAWHTTR